jgi:alpha-glucosidase
VPDGVLAFDRIALAPGGRPPRPPRPSGDGGPTGPRARQVGTPPPRPAGAGVLTCVLAAGVGATLAMPGRVMLASGPLEHDGQTLVLPADTAAWVMRGSAPRTAAGRR